MFCFTPYTNATIIILVDFAMALRGLDSKHCRWPIWVTSEKRTRHACRLTQLKLGYLTSLLLAMGLHSSVLSYVFPDCSWQPSVPPNCHSLPYCHPPGEGDNKCQNLCTGNIQHFGMIFQGFCLTGIFDTLSRPHGVHCIFVVLVPRNCCLL